MKSLGIIGYGTRLSSVMFESMIRDDRDFEIAAVCDINIERAKELANRTPSVFKNCKYYTDPDQMLETEKLDGLMIGTRCDSHASLAIKGIERGIPLFLEKPVCISLEQLDALKQANQKYQPKVVVSFPLRITNIVRKIKGIIDSGIIGEVEQIQAFNDVPYGGIYYHDWYRDDSVTGGLWLQKATHDLDYLLYTIGKKPIEICAMSSKEIFKGNHPKGTTCDNCPDASECPESPENIAKRGEDCYGTGCCFAEDTGNMDCGSAIVKYDGGILSYNQNFFARFGAKRRGARFYGYLGTLEFDFQTEIIKIYYHMENKTEIYELPKIAATHDGGDAELCEIFWRMVCGEAETSMLDDGIRSAEMCLAARKSCEESKFIKISE